MNKKLDREVEELFNPWVIHVCKNLKDLKDAEFFTKDIVDDSFNPKDKKPEFVPQPARKPAPKPAPNSVSKGKHVQLFKMRCKVGKGFYLVPVNQNASN